MSPADLAIFTLDEVLPRRRSSSFELDSPALSLVALGAAFALRRVCRTERVHHEMDPHAWPLASHSVTALLLLSLLHLFLCSFLSLFSLSLLFSSVSNPFASLSPLLSCFTCRSTGLHLDNKYVLSVSNERGFDDCLVLSASISCADARRCHRCDGDALPAQTTPVSSSPSPLPTLPPGQCVLTHTMPGAGTHYDPSRVRRSFPAQ